MKIRNVTEIVHKFEHKLKLTKRLKIKKIVFIQPSIQKETCFHRSAKLIISKTVVFLASLAHV